LNRKVYFLENKIRKKIRESQLNRIILNKIESEASILGKAKLICVQLIDLEKKLKREKTKSTKENIKHQMLFLYIELYKVNHVLHNAIVKEISNNSVHLRKRISGKIKLQHVYKDLFNRLKDIAKKLTTEGIYHLNKYNSGIKDKKAHLRLASKSARELVEIYNLLRAENHIMKFRSLLIFKVNKMFRVMLKGTSDNSKMISNEIFALESNKYSNKLNMIVSIINEQIKELHNFSIKFNSYIIHSEPFYVGKQKHIIITHDVKPVF